MKSLRVLSGSLMALTLAACTSLQVRSDFDDPVALHQLATYDWVDSPAAESGHPALAGGIVERRVRGAVDGQLSMLGYQKVTSTSPDFVVAYRLLGEEVTTTDGSYYYDPFYGYYGGRRFCCRRFGFSRSSYGFITRREHVEGIVVLDFIDAQTDEVIWRGWAVGALGSNPKPEKVNDYIMKAVKEVLQDFPAARLRPTEASLGIPGEHSRSQVSFESR